MANKDQLTATALELGIDVDALPQNGQDGPSNRTLEEAIAAASSEVPVNVDTFIVQSGGSSALAVPLAGLLAAQPHLRGEDLKPSEWQRQLDAYLTGHKTEPSDGSDEPDHDDDA